MVRKNEVSRIAGLIPTAGRTARDVLMDAVDLGVAQGLSAPELVALIDLLEERLGTELHPVRFD
ncbi:MAG: hypothetical protein AB1918_08580 [Pseudomonadota bacterium]